MIRNLCVRMENFGISLLNDPVLIFTVIIRGRINNGDSQQFTDP